MLNTGHPARKGDVINFHFIQNFHRSCNEEHDEIINLLFHFSAQSPGVLLNLSARQIDSLWCWFFPAGYNHLEESSSLKEVQFKLFCLLVTVKTSCILAVNVYETPLSHMNSVKWSCSPRVLVAQWIEHPPSVQVMASNSSLGLRILCPTLVSCWSDNFTRVIQLHKWAWISSLKIECKALNSPWDTVNISVFRGNYREYRRSFCFTSVLATPAFERNLKNHPSFQFVCLSLVRVMTSLACFAIKS